MAVERRKFPRVSAACAVSYRPVYQSDANPTVTRDIGGGGVRFYTWTQLEVGTVLKIDVQMTDRPQPLRLTAEVLWSRPAANAGKEPGALPYETAAAFLKITDEDRALLIKRATGK